MKAFIHLCSFLMFVPFVWSILDRNLNDNCASNEDCAIAYSICDNVQRRCVCRDGFNSDLNGFCQPPGLACPTWAGQGVAPGKSCVWRFDQTTGREVHSCDPNREFCHVHPKTQTPSGYLEYVGHCCPKPPQNTLFVTVMCPLTVSQSNGTCPDMTGVPADMPVTGRLIRTCPYDTHDCVFYRKNAACCPLPCIGGSSHFSVNGRCYDTVMINQPCTVTSQCIGGSTCRPSSTGQSTCQCNGRMNSIPSPHCEN